MVFYILRHEKRNINSVDFFTPLNPVGRMNANVRTYTMFDKIKLDEIYSSPYKRALMTVSQIAAVKNISIKVDWGLSEYIDDESVSKHLKWPSIGEQLKMLKQYHIDNDYISTSTNEYIDTYNESEKSFIKRVDNYINYISTHSDKNILIVTHQSVTDRLILKLTGETYNLDMGECVRIDENKLFTMS